MSADLLRQLRDYGRYHDERQAPVEDPAISESNDVQIITIEKGEANDMKPKHWGMFMVAAAVVVAVVVAGGVVIASSGDDDSDLATSPAVEFELVGWWEYTDRPMGDSPMEQVRMEYHEDGHYALIAWPDVRADHGTYEFENGVLTIRHEGGRGCEPTPGKPTVEGTPTGVYELTFESEDAVTFTAISDDCGAREKVLDGAQIARIPAG